MSLLRRLGPVLLIAAWANARAAAPGSWVAPLREAFHQSPALAHAGYDRLEAWQLAPVAALLSTEGLTPAALAASPDRERLVAQAVAQTRAALAVQADRDLAQIEAASSAAQIEAALPLIRRLAPLLGAWGVDSTRLTDAYWRARGRLIESPLDRAADPSAEARRLAGLLDEVRPIDEAGPRSSEARYARSAIETIGVRSLELRLSNRRRRRPGPPSQEGQGLAMEALTRYLARHRAAPRFLAEAVRAFGAETPFESVRARAVAGLLGARFGAAAWEGTQPPDDWLAAALVDLAPRIVDGSLRARAASFLFRRASMTRDRGLLERARALLSPLPAIASART